MTDPVITVRQVIDLVGGIILLAAAYYALQARRSDNAAYRRAYGRAVLQAAACFLVLAYASFVLWPHSQAWPAQTGYHLYRFFAAMETVPAAANTQLTDYYRVLLKQIGYATGASPGVLPGILGWVEGTVRTIGLVIYTVVFTLVSLGAQVPGRIVQGVQDAAGTTED